MWSLLLKTKTVSPHAHVIMSIYSSGCFHSQQLCFIYIRLTSADVSAVVMLIAYCGAIGYCSHVQLLVISFFAPIFFAVNEMIVFKILQVRNYLILPWWHFDQKAINLVTEGTFLYPLFFSLSKGKGCPECNPLFSITI